MMLIVPMLACGPVATFEVTPTPTKTPRRIKLLPETAAPTSTPVMLQEYTPTPEVVDTPVPVPTDTPMSEVPTDTPVSEAAPTDTPPPPPPPPTDTPVPPPPPPTNTPAPPPPTQPPANQGPQVDVRLEGGSNYSVGEKVKITIVVGDPDGVASFTWGIFTQNQVGLKGGDKKCNGATECSTNIEESIPIPGTFIIGADAVDIKGNTNRGLGEIYVH